MKTHEEFHEKLNILTGILFPYAPFAEPGPENLPSLPEGPYQETLRCFGRAFAGHRDFLKGLYDIMLPKESSISGDMLLLAREQQGVCSYGLDLASGTLRYCNAGHNPPLILTDDIRVLPSQPNLPLGVIDGIEYQEQEVVLEHDDALFLYTDGLTEAENAEAQLFGEERMKQVLHGRRPSAEHLQSMQDAVRAFVGEAPQSDDLTMLFIHYLG